MTKLTSQYRVAGNKVEKRPRRLDASARIRQRTSKKVRVARYQRRTGK